MRRAWLALSTAAIAISLTWCTSEYGEQSSSPGDAGSDANVDSSAAADGGVTRDAASYPDGATVWTGNGHGYEVVAATNGITWATAKVEAVGRGGHLVTLSSEDENAFVYLLAKDVDEAWLGTSGFVRGPWIGAEQKGGPETDGGWTWVTNEPFTFTAWFEGEPDDGASSNDAGKESVVHLFAGASRGSTWNDWTASGSVKGYIVEYE